jgi:hypothetical protein
MSSNVGLKPCIDNRLVVLQQFKTCSRSNINGNIVAANAGRPSTILTTLQAYDSTFHDLWSNCVMVHNDILGPFSSPSGSFSTNESSAYSSSASCTQLVSIATSSICRPQLSRSRWCFQVPLRIFCGISRHAQTGSTRFFRTTAHDLHIQSHPRQRSLYPKLTDTHGKSDCLLCFHSAFPAPRNLCQSIPA